jgi:hypothetical protein
MQSSALGIGANADFEEQKRLFAAGRTFDTLNGFLRPPSLDIDKRHEFIYPHSGVLILQGLEVRIVCLRIGIRAGERILIKVVANLL